MATQAKRDYYEVLGVERTASEQEIKSSYRKLAMQYHPDRNPGNPQAEDKFKEASEAYSVLIDGEKRARYDQFGHAGLGNGGFGGFDPSTFTDFSDIFGDLFSGRGRRQRGPARGPDQESEITIDFASAVKGGTFNMRIGDAGDITVRIPPGADEGSRVRIPGQGAPGPRGGPRGDLLLNIHVRTHPFFRREGDDLHLDLPVTVGEAFRGAKVKVPTPDGSVTLKVPPHTQSGQVARLKGKGVAKRRPSADAAAGDLYVHFLVQLPTVDSEAVQHAIETLDQAWTGDPRERIEF